MKENKFKVGDTVRRMLAVGAAADIKQGNYYKVMAAANGSIQLEINDETWTGWWDEGGFELQDEMPAATINSILNARGKTHGDFTDHARITQRLKEIISDELIERRQRGQPELANIAVEALDMITHKIGRIIAGRWDFDDHWQDIAGYAKLVADRVPK